MGTAEGAALSIPDDEEPHRCPYCAFPFRREQHRTLHLGLAHGDQLDAAERERYEETLDEEDHDLFTLHVKLTVGILLLYFVLTYTYIFVWV